MSLQHRLKKLEKNLDANAENVDRLIDRMQARAELNMMPELEAAIERANTAARAAGLSEKKPPSLSRAARQFAEVDSPGQAAADQKRYHQLVMVGAIDGDWRARNGGIVPAPEPMIAEAQARRDQQQDAGGGADGGARR